MNGPTRPAAGAAPLTLGLVGVGLIALCVSLGLAISETASASPDSPRRATCRGPASPGGFFRLTDRRKVVGKRTNCKTARKVVKRFPRSCAEAYAAQGSCKVRASGRWRCRSRIAGSLFDGAPSKEKCKRRRSKLKFEVAYFPPTEPSSRNRLSLRRGPYDERGECVDTSEPGTVIPPPAPSVGGWEIHLMRGVRRGVGEDLQAALVANRVAAVFHAGLGSQARNHPERIPIFVTRGTFDSERNLGVVRPSCGNDAVDGIVLTARQEAPEIARTAAHELFHAYSLGLDPRGDGWWEEAAATWSPGRAGFGEDAMYDIDLQYPEPLDSSRRKDYPYAMSRFVQFLDDRGFIGDPAWPLQRDVIHGYDDPGATVALADEIKERASTLGVELAAFWGDRLRDNPLHGPQLRPTARNAKRVRVIRGGDLGVKADRLDTSLLDFKLGPDVNRVEFEFHPPAEDGFFWGLVEPDESRQFRNGDSVSFCVGGGDEDDLEWPGHFPVTFTNGALANQTIAGTVTVEAQTGAEQCTNPDLNRACRLLNRAGVGRLLGPNRFYPIDVPRPRQWGCRYGDLRAVLHLRRYRRAAEARRNVRRVLDDPGHRSIGIGDLAAIAVMDRGDGEPSAAVNVAVGRENFVVLSFRSAAITMAKRIARELG